MKNVSFLRLIFKSVVIVLLLPVLFFARASQQGCVNPPEGMVGWWTGDNNTNDISGLGNNSTLLGSATYGVGKVANSFIINAHTDFVKVANHASLNFGNSQNFSIDAWIRTTQTDRATIVDKRSGTNTNPVGYTFFVSSGKLGFQLSDGSPFFNHMSTNPTINDGNWHHVAVTINRTSNTGGCLYIDGALNLTFDPTTHPNTISNTANLWIGQHQISSAQTYHAFQGAIDEVEIFNRVLTASEVNSIFAADYFGKCKSPCLSTQTVTISTSVPNGILRFSSTQANGAGLQAFNGALGYDSPRKIFVDSIMVVTPCECKPVLLKLAKVNFNGDYDPTFDANDPNMSYGYRYLRAATAAAAKQQFAQYIINNTVGYAFQEFSVNVPLSAWDVSDQNNPKRLAVGFLENNVLNGLVDGKYWPGSSNQFDNVAANGPREWLFIFDEPYSTSPNNTNMSNMIGTAAPHRVMYMATWNRINQSVFSPTNSGDDQFLINSIITSVKNENEIPTNFSLLQNYPNPFNSTTTISYKIPVAGFISLKVYDLLGREVATLVNEFQQPGYYVESFNGSSLPSGIYFYRLQAGEFQETLKLILLK